jgi:hypothetical protein
MFFVLTISLAFPSLTYPQQRVVVLTRTQNIAMNSSRSGRLGSASDDAVAEIASAALLRRGYRVIERTVLNAVLREQGFQYSGVVNQADAVQVGRLAGADAIFMINIYGVSKRYQREERSQLPSFSIPGLSGVNPGQLMGRKGGNVIEMQMTLKLIDAQSAEILWLEDKSAESQPDSATSTIDLVREMVAGISFPPPGGGKTSVIIPVTSSSRRYRITTATVLRDKPEENGKAIAQLRPGTVIHVVSTMGKWLKIESKAVPQKPPGYVWNADAAPEVETVTE